MIRTTFSYGLNVQYNSKFSGLPAHHALPIHHGQQSLRFFSVLQKHQKILTNLLQFTTFNLTFSTWRGHNLKGHFLILWRHKLYRREKLAMDFCQGCLSYPIIWTCLRTLLARSGFQTGNLTDHQFYLFFVMHINKESKQHFWYQSADNHALALCSFERRSEDGYRFSCGKFSAQKKYGLGPRYPFNFHGRWRPNVWNERVTCDASVTSISLARTPKTLLRHNPLVHVCKMLV